MGMVRALDPESLPQVAVEDAVNTLYGDQGDAYRRGGSSYRSTNSLTPGSPITFMWDGWLSTGQTTMIANETRLSTLHPDTGVISEQYGVGFTKPQRAVAMDGILYMPGGITFNGTAIGTAVKNVPYYASVAGRLLAAVDDKVMFSGIGTPTVFNDTDFHQLPGGVKVLGIEGLRDSAAVFTTDGIWMISNLAMDLTDDAGNVQQRLDQYSRDIVLWGNAGIAAWQGGLIVPATDAVWQLSLGVTSEAPQPFARLSQPIDSLYQDYVNRGYQPGLATVYRSHYILPILSGNSVVDTLVCKLSLPSRPWSRMQGSSARCAALAQHRQDGTPAPQLIGGSSLGRILNLHWFEPGALTALEADASLFDWDMLLRSYATGSLNMNTVTKLRAGYQLVPLTTSSPVIKAYARRRHQLAGVPDVFWGMFDWGQADWTAPLDDVLLSTDAPVDIYGTSPHSWGVRIRDRFVQFRLRSSQPSQSLKLKRVELLIRSGGRM